jgi:serine/threonine protein kinase
MADTSERKGHESEDQDKDSTESERLFQEFIRRLESGDSVDPKEYFSRYPELEDDLKLLFESLKHRIPSTRKSIEKDQLLGDFRILGEIGNGAMGIVYEAEQVSLGRPVALKALSRHLCFSDSAVRKFQREGEALARLNHPGVVIIHAVGEQDGVHYIAQELVSGGYTMAEKLADLRRDKASLEDPSYYEELAGLMMNVADALQHAHAAGVIHRDVKPSNILLTGDGLPKLTDFGLAKIEDALALSRTGDFCGTPYYMSPEQAMSRRMGIDHRTDVFSLGATLYEALTLERPFKGESSHEVLKKVVMYDPQDPRKTNPRVPRDLAVICLKALEKNPDRRYPDMEEFREDLQRFLTGELIHARPVGAAAKLFRRLQRNAALSITAAVAVLAVAALAVILWTGILFRTRLPDTFLDEVTLKVAAVNTAYEPMPFDRLPQDVTKELAALSGRFLLQPDPNRADWLLVMDDKDLWLESTRPGGGFGRIQVYPDRLMGELERIFVNWALVTLAESENIADLPDGFEMIVEKKPAAGEGNFGQQSGCVCKPGDRLRIKLVNGTDHPYKIALFLIDEDCYAASLINNERELETLLPSDALTVLDEDHQDEILIDDRYQGTEFLLVMALPELVSRLEWITRRPPQATYRGTEEPPAVDRLAELQKLLDKLRHLQDLSFENALLPPPAIRLFTLRTAWPEPRPPSSWMGGQPVELPSDFHLEKPQDGIPDPWQIGPRACLADSSPERTGDLLLAGDTRPMQVLIDVDGELTRRAEDPLERIRGFDAEAAFHFLADRRIAFYDTDSDGEFDLVLVARKGSAIAHTRHVLTWNGWRTERNVNMPWLSTAYFDDLWDHPRLERALGQFAILTGGS